MPLVPSSDLKTLSESHLSADHVTHSLSQNGNDAFCTLIYIENTRYTDGNIQGKAKYWPCSGRFYSSWSRCRNSHARKHVAASTSILLENKDSNRSFVYKDKGRSTGLETAYSLRRSTMSQHWRLLGRFRQVKSHSYHHAHGGYMHERLSLLFSQDFKNPSTIGYT